MHETCQRRRGGRGRGKPEAEFAPAALSRKVGFRPGDGCDPSWWRYFATVRRATACPASRSRAAASASLCGGSSEASSRARHSTAATADPKNAESGWTWPSGRATTVPCTARLTVDGWRPERASDGGPGQRPMRGGTVQHVLPLGVHHRSGDTSQGARAPVDDVQQCPSVGPTLGEPRRRRLPVRARVASSPSTPRPRSPLPAPSRPGRRPGCGR